MINQISFKNYYNSSLKIWLEDILSLSSYGSRYFLVLGGPILYFFMDNKWPIQLEWMNVVNKHMAHLDINHICAECLAQILNAQ